MGIALRDIHIFKVEERRNFHIILKTKTLVLYSLVLILELNYCLLINKSTFLLKLRWSRQRNIKVYFQKRNIVQYLASQPAQAVKNPDRQG